MPTVDVKGIRDGFTPESGSEFDDPAAITLTSDQQQKLDRMLRLGSLPKYLDRKNRLARIQAQIAALQADESSLSAEVATLKQDLLDDIPAGLFDLVPTDLLILESADGAQVDGIKVQADE